ncbi:glycoside hydrolase [Sphingomonas sp. Leaf412]|nr:glycoside hydrolase [Sphingomonas sp. Leaf412]
MALAPSATRAQAVAEPARPAAPSPSVPDGRATAEAGTGPRVAALLAQMTLAEKLAMIRGGVEPAATYQGQAGYIAGVPRLGIPPLRLADGPPGVLTRLPSHAPTAPMGLAATFSRSDARDNGTVIAREARSLGIDVVLQPFINISRDFAFLRSYNMYGEDPLLVGEIGAAVIRGVQAEGVMAQAKHFIGYDSASFNVFIDQQSLHEIDLAPFDAAVKAGVASIMCSYNKVNGENGCGNKTLLTDVLRGELGFRGFVTSDWGGVHAPTYISAGLDMEMPGQLAEDSFLKGLMFSFFDPAPAKPLATFALPLDFVPPVFPEEGAPIPVDMSGVGSLRDPLVTFGDQIAAGTLDEAAITRAAGRVLSAYERFGYLDTPPSHAIKPRDVAANAAIIRRTAGDAAVLLKNEGGILPLRRADLAALAMIGPGAGQVVAVGPANERSTGLVERQVGPLEAMRTQAPDARIAYAVASDMTGVPIPASMLSHDGKPGLRSTGADGRTRIDPIVDFTKAAGRSMPANQQRTWTGTLTVPSAGRYYLYLHLLGATGALSIDGKKVGTADGLIGALHGDTVLPGKDGLMPTVDGLDNLRMLVELSAGPHSLTLETRGDTSGSPAQVRLAWSTPDQRRRDHDAAVAAAKKARTAVVFVWHRYAPFFALPGEQDRLVADIAAVNPNTVVVMNTSQPVAMPWLKDVKAVVQMWWPGDEGGWATADVLLGKTNPAGRLPFTWARKPTDYADNDPRHPERSGKGVDGRTVFTEGVHVGYRWFDRARIAPLFPFGFGLSYTRFGYDGLTAAAAPDGGIDVGVTITNEGTVDGDEVPQVYLGPPGVRPAGADFPARKLVAFDRVRLAAGEKRVVRLHVEPRQLHYWSTAQKKWMLPEGGRTIGVGASSRDVRVETRID